MIAPIIVALDGTSEEKSLSIAKNVSNKIWGFKMHELLIREGFDLLQKFKEHGNVFVDLKFHDIPETVIKEIEAINQYDVDLLTVHAGGGIEMLKAAVSVGGDKIVAVTTLTSQEKAGSVIELAKQAYEAGVQTITCSAHEVSNVKELFPELKIITPGIRMPNDHMYDQKRVSTPQDALNVGADLLVIGRPITNASNPSLALSNILSSLN